MFQLQIIEDKGGDEKLVFTARGRSYTVNSTVGGWYVFFPYLSDVAPEIDAPQAITISALGICPPANDVAWDQ